MSLFLIYIWDRVVQKDYYIHWQKKKIMTMVIVVWRVGEMTNISTCQASETEVFKICTFLYWHVLLLKSGRGESIWIEERENKTRERNVTLFIYPNCWSLLEWSTPHGKQITLSLDVFISWNSVDVKSWYTQRKGKKLFFTFIYLNG